MKFVAFALFPAVVLTVVAGIWVDQLGHPKRNVESLRAQAPQAIRWMPTWLLEPIEKAIADANDPRDRKTRR